jgi:hypothetical protein
VPVLTTFDHDWYVFDALAAGASGFLLEDAPEHELLAAIRVVASGGSQFWLADVPSGTWRRLKDRRERLLPIWIRVHGLEVDVQVGDRPSRAVVLPAIDVLPRFAHG